jgi:hypothetical protein
MQIWNFEAARTGALILAAAIAMPTAVGADIFAWRTEDGVFSYTDDRENIPSRYADDAVSVPDSRLGAYKRLTVEDSAATREVTTRLERRLDYLRQLNAAAPAPAQVLPPSSLRQMPCSVAANSAGLSLWLAVRPK